MVLFLGGGFFGGVSSSSDSSPSPFVSSDAAAASPFSLSPRPRTDNFLSLDMMTFFSVIIDDLMSAFVLVGSRGSRFVSHGDSGWCKVSVRADSCVSLSAR